MGTKNIIVGERELVLHPCPAVGLQAIGANFDKIGTDGAAGLEALIDGIYYGVKRGARDDATITREFFAWNIDSTNCGDLISAFAEVNNAVPQHAAEGATSGEA